MAASPVSSTPASSSPVSSNPVSANSVPAVPAVSAAIGEQAPVAGRGQAGRASLAAATSAVFVQQLSRARIALVPLLFVGAFQSLGILVLLRGVVDTSSVVTTRQIVAGSTVLVAGFVCLNLFAQRLGALRAEGGLDYYAAMDVRGSAVILGAAGSYAVFFIPGAVATALVGAELYDLPFNRLWILLAVLPLAGVSLAGVGALLGLLAPKPELATIAGQLGMSAVIFLNLIPAHRLPAVVRPIRLVVPSTYATDAFAKTFRPDVSWATVGIELSICALAAVGTLALASALFRRQVGR